MASTRSVTEITNHILQQAWPDSFLPVSSPRGYVISLAGTVVSVWPFVGAEVCFWRVMRASLRDGQHRCVRSFSRGGGPRGRPRHSKGLKTHPTRTDFLEFPPIDVSPSLQARFSENCQSGPPACLRPVRCLGGGGRGLPERPPPPLCLWSCGLPRG